MATVRKIRIRVKWKNLIAFLLFLFFLIFGIIELIVCVVKVVNPPKKVKEKQVVAKKINTNKDIKLNKLDNIDKEIDFFNMEYLDRYVLYKEKHPEMPNKQVIKDVNMNLDKEFYKDPTPAKNLNKETILVNKYYYLEKNYVPNNLETISTRFALSNMKLVKEAKDAFEEMASAAKKENLNIIAMSTYRSYDYQVNLYNKYVRTDGKEAADTYSGRPGHSEHQTGLVIDMTSIKEKYDDDFTNSEAYKWLKENAYKYGFIERYPEGKTYITGYSPESWHWRYVGYEIAKKIHDEDITYDEYYAYYIEK